MLSEEVIVEPDYAELTKNAPPMFGVKVFNLVTAELYTEGQVAQIELSIQVKVEPVKVIAKDLES